MPSFTVIMRHLKVDMLPKHLKTWQGKNETWIPEWNKNHLRLYNRGVSQIVYTRVRSCALPFWRHRLTDIRISWILTNIGGMNFVKPQKIDSLDVTLTHLREKALQPIKLQPTVWFLALVWTLTTAEISDRTRQCPCLQYSQYGWIPGQAIPEDP